MRDGSVRHPQLLIYEGEGRLAAMLRPVAAEHKWSVREPRQLESCLRLLRRGGPAVLVLEAGGDLERELTLLERVAWLHPDAAVVFVGEASHAELAGLTWDLGAAYVLLAAQVRERLADVVVTLMSRSVREK
jgi:hypothetical protein